jgi:hypothetical protein
MRTLVFMLALTCASGDAVAGLFEAKNPDVPGGGIALDFLANTSVAGNLDKSSWDLVDFVSFGEGLVADGLTVRSEADFSTTDLGFSLMTAVSTRITAQLHYRYTKLEIDNVTYTAAGILSPPDLRLSPPYETTSDYHTIGVRFRVWLGADSP